MMEWFEIVFIWGVAFIVGGYAIENHYGKGQLYGKEIFSYIIAMGLGGCFMLASAALQIWGWL